MSDTTRPHVVVGGTPLQSSGARASRPLTIMSGRDARAPEEMTRQLEWLVPGGDEMSDAAVEWLDVAAARQRLEAGSLLAIDLRGPPDYAGGRIPGSISLPGRAIESRWKKVPAGRTLLFVDDDDGRAEAVCALARAQGLVATALRGGFEAWFDAGYPIETMSDGLPPLEDA